MNLKTNIELTNEVNKIIKEYESKKSRYHKMNKIEAVYDAKLHSLFIGKIIEVHGNLKAVAPFDLTAIEDFSILIHDLSWRLHDYLQDCFIEEDGLALVKYNPEKFKSLIEQVITLKQIIKNAKAEETIVLEIKQNQLESFMDKHSKGFMEKCSKFSLNDNKLISRIIEIMNAFENEEYTMISRTVIGKNDHHGKSNDTDVYYFVTESVAKSIPNYLYSINIGDIVGDSKYECCISYLNSKNANFSESFSYINLFLDELAEWRFKHYLPQVPTILEKLPKGSNPIENDIPDDVLDLITLKYIRQAQEENKDDKVLSKKN